jgi:hypothetical protein
VPSPGDRPGVSRLPGSQDSFKQFGDKFSDAGRLGFARTGDVQNANFVSLDEF